MARQTDGPCSLDAERSSQASREGSTGRNCRRGQDPDCRQGTDGQNLGLSCGRSVHVHRVAPINLVRAPLALSRRCGLNGKGNQFGDWPKDNGEVAQRRHGEE